VQRTKNLARNGGLQKAKTPIRRLAFTGTRQNDTQELLYAKSNNLSSEKDWAKSRSMTSAFFCAPCTSEAFEIRTTPAGREAAWTGPLLAIPRQTRSRRRGYYGGDIVFRESAIECWKILGDDFLVLVNCSRQILFNCLE
jgi:hypothetical protein